MVEARLFDKKSAPELLEEFRATGAQAPFEEIVRRYAGMVYSCCLRVTKNSHDAEDATQAVFLALAVQGKTAKPIRYIGPWLQQVAHRLSLDIRRSKKRQKAREEKVGQMMRSTNGNGANGHPNGNGNGNGKHGCPSKAFEDGELKRIINDEINQLPSKYRLPLILHYFGGLTREEMARELGVRPNTLGVRVFRGRELLGKRLAARGMTLGGGALAVMLTDSVALRINESLILSTCHAVAAATGGMGGGPSVSASVFGAQVAGIMHSISRGMLLSKIKVVAAVLVALGTVTAGGAEMISRVGAGLDLRFPLPLDITSRLRDLFRSFVRPIQYLSATMDDEADAGEATTIAPLGAHERLYAVGSLHYADPLAERYFRQQMPPSSAPPQLPARDQGRAVHASVQASSGALDSPEAALHVESGAASSATHVVAGANAPAEAKPTSGSGLPKVHSLAAAPIRSLRPAAEIARPSSAGTALPDLVLGDAGAAAAPGAPDAKFVTAGQSHQWRSLTVGDVGPATFRQTGGSTRIETDLTVARTAGSSGKIELAGGEFSTGGHQLIGLRGEGQFIQSGGTNVVGGSLFVGFDGKGSYAITGGKLSGDAIKVAFTGEGHFTQGGKPVAIASSEQPPQDVLGGPPVVRFNTASVADKQGSRGEFSLYEGDFTAGNQVIGRAGEGAVVQAGGTNTATTIWLGSAHQSIGSYVLSGGTLRLDPDASLGAEDSCITVGGAGSGVFRMGDENRAAKIVEAQSGTNLAVRAKSSGSGLFSGWGSVGLTGLVVNNGKVIADGYGKDRALDLSSAAGVTNTIENPVSGGTNGWFATDGGALVLPPIDVAPGSRPYSWGEDPNDALPDLVNSVRLFVHGATDAGEINISLLSLDRADVPTLPGGHSFIGVWSFDAAGLDFEGVDLAVRYDDALAEAKGLSESVLKLWKYENDAWVRINDESFRRYGALNVLSGYAGADLTFFAVSAPEPTSLGGAILGSWMLLRRRRRQ